MRWTDKLFGRRLATFLREERGNATVEFTVLVLPLITIIFTLAELGVFMSRSVMVSRGTDLAIRDVRLGSLPVGGTYDPDGPSGPEPAVSDDGLPMKQRICEGAFLITDCVTSIQIEMRPLNNISLFNTATVECVDEPASETITPVNAANFTPGAPNQIMFVRVCLVVNPLFPGVGFGARLARDALSGGYAIVAETAFMNEPS